MPISRYDSINAAMIKEYLERAIDVKKAALTDASFLENTEKAGQHIHKSLMADSRIYIAGVGGAAAESQHFSAELLGKYKSMRKAFPAVALTTDTSMLTAWANDTSFDFIFSRQLEGLGKNGDIFLGMSAGGNSPSILEALKVAKSLGMFSICLLGKGGGQAKNMCDIAVVVPSDVTAYIQEIHLSLIHYFCEFFESKP
jgi:D-sedoheptulose 7-phosphate isomerase